MSGKMVVRAANFSDIVRALPLAQAFHAASPYRNTPFDSASTFDSLARSHQQELLFVAETGGQIVGLVAGLEYPCLWNDLHVFGTETVWYVDPAHRDSGAGRALLQAIERSAQDKGLDCWTMVRLEAVEPEKADAIYLKHGYRRQEVAYTKDLSWQV